MFTEAPFGENAGESRAVSSLVDLDFGIEKSSVSPMLYESTCVRADESSGIMVTSDVSATDGLLSSLESISFAESPFLGNGIAKVNTGSIDTSTVREANLHGQRLDEFQGSSRHDSSDSDRVQLPSRHGDDEDEFVRTRNSNDLIVYTSSRRNSSRNNCDKLNMNNDSKDPSRNCNVNAQNESLLDLKPLHIARRKRSLLSKHAKSSVCGFESSPAFGDSNEPDPPLGNGEKIGRARGGLGNGNDIGDKTGKKSVQKSSTPTGCISLKIKIGNQSCGSINLGENIILPRKKNSGLCDIKESKFQDEFTGEMLLPHENNLEKRMTSNTSVLGTLDVTNSVENKSSRASTENRCSDPGTSPDSEVINCVPDASLCERGTQNCQVMPPPRSNKKCFANSIGGVSFAGFSSSSLPKTKSRKGKKITDSENRHKVRALLDPVMWQKPVDLSKCDDYSPGNSLQNAGNEDRVSSSPVGCSRMTNSEAPCSTSNEICGGSEVNPSSELSDAIQFSKTQAQKSFSTCSNGKKFLKFSRAKGECTGRSGALDFSRKKANSSGKMGSKNSLIVKYQTDVEDGTCNVLGRVERHLEAGNRPSPDLGEVGEPSIHSAGTGFVSSSDWLNCHYSPPRNAWVSCDECQKWRRIPAPLADQIDQTNCQWTCKDNTDKDFADCSISQEKSNSEINEELGISDASCDENAGDTLLKSNKNKSTAAKQSSWTLIKSNLFLHRCRKTQSIDEVMVCHCKPPSDGRMGCGAKCLNRMLNIECVQGTCPCGERCSNQQFQKRIYAKLKWLRCGKKGFGLQALEDISEGQFLIEYVGEVSDFVKI